LFAEAVEHGVDMRHHLFADDGLKSHRVVARRMYGKTDTGRQADLVKLVAGFSNSLVG
jgi:hypothetical protein